MVQVFLVFCFLYPHLTFAVQAFLKMEIQRRVVDPKLYFNETSLAVYEHSYTVSVPQLEYTCSKIFMMFFFSFHLEKKMWFSYGNSGLVLCKAHMDKRLLELAQ